ncbi:hypothetical protein UPYG_G00076410 [Umbra pygmaea]|uniref:Uncharacterized protein n=1 Tax=Umbra pygmaea TaxID=75934 RepID=A0ABD0XCV2_UMBPY
MVSQHNKIVPKFKKHPKNTGARREGSSQLTPVTGPGREEEPQRKPTAGGGNNPSGHLPLVSHDQSGARHSSSISDWSFTL